MALSSPSFYFFDAFFWIAIWKTITFCAIDHQTWVCSKVWLGIWFEYFLKRITFRQFSVMIVRYNYYHSNPVHLHIQYSSENNYEKTVRATYWSWTISISKIYMKELKRYPTLLSNSKRQSKNPRCRYKLPYGKYIKSL